LAEVCLRKARTGIECRCFLGCNPQTPPGGAPPPGPRSCSRSSCGCCRNRARGTQLNSGNSPDEDHQRLLGLSSGLSLVRSERSDGPAVACSDFFIFSKRTAGPLRLWPIRHCAPGVRLARQSAGGGPTNLQTSRNTRRRVTRPRGASNGDLQG
jgi:hypothetical protein